MKKAVFSILCAIIFLPLSCATTWQPSALLSGFQATEQSNKDLINFANQNYQNYLNILNGNQQSLGQSFIEQSMVSEFYNDSTNGKEFDNKINNYLVYPCCNDDVWSSISSFTNTKLSKPLFCSIPCTGENCLPKCQGVDDKSACGVDAFNYFLGNYSTSDGQSIVFMPNLDQYFLNNLLFKWVSPNSAIYFDKCAEIPSSQNLKLADGKLDFDSKGDIIISDECKKATLCLNYQTQSALVNLALEDNMASWMASWAANIFKINSDPNSNEAKLLNLTVDSPILGFKNLHNLVSAVIVFANLFDNRKTKLNEQQITFDKIIQYFIDNESSLNQTTDLKLYSSISSKAEKLSTPKTKFIERLTEKDKQLLKPQYQIIENKGQKLFLADYQSSLYRDFILKILVNYQANNFNFGDLVKDLLNKLLIQQLIIGSDLDRNKINRYWFYYYTKIPAEQKPQKDLTANATNIAAQTLAKKQDRLKSLSVSTEFKTPEFKTSTTTQTNLESDILSKSFNDNLSNITNLFAIGNDINLNTIIANELTLCNYFANSEYSPFKKPELMQCRLAQDDQGKKDLMDSYINLWSEEKDSIPIDLFQCSIDNAFKNFRSFLNDNSLAGAGINELILFYNILILNQFSCNNVVSCGVTSDVESEISKLFDDFTNQVANLANICCDPNSWQQILKATPGLPGSLVSNTQVPLFCKVNCTGSNCKNICADGQNSQMCNKFINYFSNSYTACNGTLDSNGKCPSAYNSLSLIKTIPYGSAYYSKDQILTTANIFSGSNSAFSACGSISYGSCSGGTCDNAAVIINNSGSNSIWLTHGSVKSSASNSTVTNYPLETECQKATVCLNAINNLKPNLNDFVDFANTVFLYNTALAFKNWQSQKFDYKKIISDSKDDLQKVLEGDKKSSKYCVATNQSTPQIQLGSNTMSLDTLNQVIIQCYDPKTCTSDLNYNCINNCIDYLLTQINKKQDCFTDDKISATCLATIQNCAKNDSSGKLSPEAQKCLDDNKFDVNFIELMEKNLDQIKPSFSTYDIGSLNIFNIHSNNQKSLKAIKAYLEGKKSKSKFLPNGVCEGLDSKQLNAEKNYTDQVEAFEDAHKLDDAIMMLPMMKQVLPKILENFKTNKFKSDIDKFKENIDKVKDRLNDLYKKVQEKFSPSQPEASDSAAGGDQDASDGNSIPNSPDNALPPETAPKGPASVDGDIEMSVIPDARRMLENLDTDLQGATGQASELANAKGPLDESEDFELKVPE